MISFRLGASLTLLVVGLSVASLVALYDGTLLPNDTAQYLSVARHLEKGEGLATDLVFFPEHHAQETMPAKETGFAPGFPLLVAGAAALGLPLEDAAFLVTAMSLGLAAILIFLLVNRSARSPGIAWCALLIWLGMVFNWFNSWERLSELPFIVCTLMATGLYPRSGVSRAAPLALVGVATAGAIAIRYAGIFFFIAILAVVMADCVRRQGHNFWRPLVAFASAPIVVIAVLFWRNYQIVGDVKGGNALVQEVAVFEMLGRFAKALLHLSGFTRAGFAEFAAPELTLMVSLVMSVALLVWQGGAIHLDRSAVVELRNDRYFRIAAVFVLVSLPLLMLSDLMTSVTLQARMLLVLAPFVLLVGGSALSAMRLTSTKSRRVVGLICALLAVTYLTGQSRVVAWQHSRPNHYLLAREALESSVGQQKAVDFLSSLTSDEHPLLGNEPQMLGAVVVGPVVGLPPSPYSDVVWDFDAVRAVVERYGVEYVVFMPELRTVSSEEVQFYDQLASGEYPSWLVPFLEGPTLVLFRVLEPFDKDL